jgi:hypothetical protein
MDLERGAEVTFKWVTAGAPLADARQLIAEFGDKSTVDLGFQDFEAELANLPAPYSAPGRPAMRLPQRSRTKTVVRAEDLQGIWSWAATGRALHDSGCGCRLRLSVARHVG